MRKDMKNSDPRKSLKIMTILGTRPEIIRLSRLIPRLDGACEHVLVHTGQNYDAGLSDVFFDELGVRAPDVDLQVRGEGFAGQVALVHGDSHYFKIDKPINLPSGGVLANFTRVETFGARQTHWVSATIDPQDPNLFEFQPRLVPANVG